MDITSLISDAIEGRIPEYMLFVIVVIGLGYLFMQFNYMNKHFTAETEAANKRIAELAVSVRRCNDSHSGETNKLWTAISTFQVQVARDTMTRTEFDVRMRETHEVIRQSVTDALQPIREDMSLIKDRLITKTV